VTTYAFVAPWQPVAVVAVPLADLCTLTDLENLIQVTIPAADLPAAEAAIATASAMIRTHTGQTLTLVRNDAVVLSTARGGALLATFNPSSGGDWGGGGALYGGAVRSIWLPELPVIDVTAVSVHGTDLTTGDWGFEPDTGRLVRLWNTYGVGGWPHGYQNLAVTYSHGYPVLPADIVNVCARVVARAYLAGKRAALVGPHAREADYTPVYQGESISDVAGAYGPTSAPILTGHEREVLAKYRVVPLGAGASAW
jgi:hypothetical protein